MAFHIGNGRRIAERELIPQVAEVPVLIPCFLGKFDPQIGDPHAEAVIKPDAAVRNLFAHSRHTGHVLRHGNGRRFHFADQFVGELEIGHGVHIRVHGEILVERTEIRSECMVEIQHGGHAVKAEAVKMVFLQPESQIAQQEMQHFRLAVVEALGAPGRVVASAALVEELIGCAVKQIDALQRIADGVGMHHIQQNANAHAVRPVHKIFQILGVTEAAGSCIEAAHLIAEGSIEGMLHHRHQLDGVIAEILHMRKHLVGKLAVGGDAVILA